MSDEEARQHLVAKPIAAWMRQLETATRVIAAKNGAPPATLLHAYYVDPIAYAALIEARLALNPAAAGHIPRGLIDLAIPFLPRSDEAR